VEFGDRCSKPAAMASRRFPVTSKQLVTTIQGQKTEVVQCCYDDHIMVIVTQIGKMGTLLHARKEEGYGTAPTFNVSILMGKRDEPLMVACARQLIEQISKGGLTRPLILSLGLSDHSAGALKEIIQVIVANKIW
jgi:proteasome assembly chaperone 3